MKRSLFAFGTALVVVAGAFLIRFYSQSGAADQHRPDDSSRGRESESPPAVTTQTGNPTIVISPSLPVTRPDTESPPYPLPSDEGTEPHQPPSYEALASRFQAETRDEAWAAAFERKIKMNLGTLPRSMVERIECKMSICTITLVHADALAYESWTASPSAAIESSAAMALRRIDGEDGSVRTESMLSVSGRER